tara:strand:- start:1506 stop:1703 length:198 start_codon:yes stop_codon:yes gene_type:complete
MTDYLQRNIFYFLTIYELFKNIHKFDKEEKKSPEMYFYYSIVSNSYYNAGFHNCLQKQLPENKQK